MLCCSMHSACHGQLHVACDNACNTGTQYVQVMSHVQPGATSLQATTIAIPVY